MEQSIIIKNNRLTIEISKPGVAYNSSRFDWTGFITQITLDNKYTYCVPEQYVKGKGSGGIGFCNEFGIDQPIGYDETPVDETFPKIGVGLLTKSKDEPYDFFAQYEVSPAEVKVLPNGDSCQFISEYKGEFATCLKKTIKVEENHLLIDYELTNRGTKTISTNEYCHNFIGINEQSMGLDYVLTVPEVKNWDLIVGQVTLENNQFTWPVMPEEDYYFTIDVDNNVGYQWDVYNKVTGSGVRDLSQFIYNKFAVWGTTHVISPELFIQIDLEPGESMKWQRVYEFYTK